jgi:lantibiotic modifying enzyme
MHDEMVIGKKNFDAGILRTGLFPVPRNARLPRYDYAVFDQGGRGPHMPILNGRVLSAGKYAREIINGFREAWNLMLTNEGPRRSLRRRLRRLKIGRWRRLYWPTSNYIAIRDASISPAALRSGAARLRALVKRCTRQGVTSSITLQEIISLERFDVPRFSQSADAEPQLPSALEISDAVRQLRAALLHDC